MEVKHKVKDRENGCPFGHTCDSCNLYVPLYKTDEKGKVTAEYDCQINNLAVLMDETKNRTLGVQRAVENRINSVMTLAAEAQRRKNGRAIEHGD